MPPRRTVDDLHITAAKRVAAEKAVAAASGAQPALGTAVGNAVARRGAVLVAHKQAAMAPF